MQPDVVRSIEYINSAAQSVGNHGAPIRFGFVANEPTDPPDRIPPLVRLLRGGQSGEVRLKLHLSLLWLASTKPRHQTKNLAHTWAILLGLADPTKKGARRIKNAVRVLEDEALISVDHKRGTANLITLLDERGEKRPYQHPGKSGGYIQLPATFWTHRWIHDMSGAALAILLVILVELFRWRRVYCWLSAAEARRRYTLSADTWTRGIAELRNLKLIEVGRLVISGNPFEEPGKYRNTYRLFTDGSAGEFHASWDDLRAVFDATLLQRSAP